MASAPTNTQKSSRWGSFLAGVESRLDTILADEETAKAAAQNRGATSSQDQSSKKDGAAGSGAGAALSRTASANRAQDRLNEKLAKAMANKNLGKKGDVSVPSSGVPSRTGSPANLTISPRTSSDVQRDTQSIADNDNTLTIALVGANGTNISGVDGEVKEELSGPVPIPSGPSTQPFTSTVGEGKEENVGPRPSIDSRSSISTRQSLELARATTAGQSESLKVNGVETSSELKLPEEYEKIIDQMRSDHEAAELRRQEETHTYLEQIDAMQAKLQYLTKEAGETAKKTLAETEPSSLEHKMSVKDEKIALLIEEGQKLSQTELKHMSIIKRLRAKATDDDKALAESKRTVERHEKAARDAQERAKRAETTEKRASERNKSLLRIEKDLETARSDQAAKDTLIQDLQLKLSQATSAAKEAEVKANAEVIDQERRRAAELADEISSIKTEKDLAEKQYQNELRELREKAEREKERARVAEIERQVEQSILESRLEAYRARAEEASAGQGGDVQAKLLRQIETLQNQYAVASENWQGIEGSLLARVTTLEKERDEIAKREADVRRKAREANTKSRRLEEELERSNAKSEDLDDEISSRTTQLATLQERLAKSEADAIATRNDLKAEREACDARLAQRIEDEKVRIREETARSTPDLYQQIRTESPLIHNHTRKSSHGDRNHQYNRRSQGLAISGNGFSPGERPLSRRSSNQPLHTLQTSEFQSQRPTTSRLDSASTLPQVSVNNGIPETPSIVGREDDFFSGFQTPATPDRTINDLISVSTAGAGPSVQLVERMSAAVRRLESEKAAHKDELARLSTQRDESREQVVSLMREVEEKRAWEQRVKEMEGNLKGLEERYLTTLEMLGEKSEKVEELKADVQDLKGMYRDLVENTLK